jgi:hypothetical protein
VIILRLPQRRLDLPDDPGVPDDPDDLLAALRPQDGSVANKLTRTFWMRRALLGRYSERRPWWTT